MQEMRQMDPDTGVIAVLYLLMLLVALVVERKEKKRGRWPP